MRAAFCSQPGTFELRDVGQPVPRAGEAVVKIRSCGICGSDLHFFHGNFPPPPVCPGHEMSGDIVDTGSDVSALHAGDRVAIEPLIVCRQCAYCRTGDYQLCRTLRIAGQMLDGGFADYVRMPAYALFPLPAAVDYEVGALAEPLAVAVHGVRLANVQLGDRVLVLGGGSIGLLSVAAAKAAGASEVWITARHPQQQAAAESLGAARAFMGPNAVTEVSASADDGAIDVVIETVGGTADTLNDALHLVRRGGSIVVLGVFTAPAALNALLLVVREVRIVGSLTYGRRATRADFDVALQLLAAQPERFRQLITHRFALTEISRGFEIASDKRLGSIKVAIQPG